ncbi:SusC/RagA family TonB-linked outer membrane protein [Dyadobacter sandarakinus]|uniref:TonB-dependent receptor n=1 Tax=Dyadobacter sandarakinus TaxID=2747268 RepID=A0ABX7I3L9_9BACT|nr:TonB-dependent receptor [Dyadobacter sandarakinus]QRR00662.1 TonB-dependent receptor [Dyadobacter sandarakinus]
MRYSTLLFSCTLALLMSAGIVYGQARTITGLVRAATGETLPGATILVTGTTNATISDADGKFSLSAATGQVLRISFIGYLTAEVPVTEQDAYTIQLEEDAQKLEEFVVIGYQSVRRTDLTGATGIIDAQNTSKRIARSVPEALQGMTPGVSVRNGGAPGQEAVVNIRGLSTLFGNANPLYVIDGMFADANTTVNPNDVETIQVLKDASAAAIYGSRAANGVIIITTKKGKEGALKVDASARFGLSSIPKRWDMMNAAEYVATNTRAYQAAGYALQPGVAGYNGTVNTNWADELLHTGSIQDYNVSLSGGGKDSKYLISGSYFADEGVLKFRDFQRGSLRINTEATRSKFTFGENLMVSSTERNTPFQGGFAEGNAWYDMWTSLPIIPVSSPDLVSTANPGGWGYGSFNARSFSRNQVAINDITKSTFNFFKILGNAFVDFKILKNLSYRFNAGLETSFDKTNDIRKEGLWYWNQSPEFSSVGQTRAQYLSYLFEHTLNFNFTFNKHNLNGVVGYTQQTIRTDDLGGRRLQLGVYGGDYFTTINSASGGMTSSGTRAQTLINSALGRLNYNFAEKYYLTLTFRADKDSRFSPGHRTGYFPSAAASWKISNEEFFKSSVINELKLRGSYGVLGSANLSNYQFTGFLNQAPRAVFGAGQTEFPGATQARLVYEDLKWEQKATANIGADVTLFNNKLAITVDAFRSVAKDVLLSLPLPLYIGNLQGDPLVNIGSIENKGIELELAYRQNAGPFSWSIAPNFSIIRNKVLELGNLGIDEETGEPRNYIQSGNTRSQVGRSIGEYYLLQTDGLFQNDEEVQAHRAQASYAKPGDIRYVNRVDQGTTDDINDRDRNFAGSPWPKLTSGLILNGTWSGLSLNIQFYGAFGQKLYNDVRREIDGLGYSNYRRGINPWTPENTGTDFPRLGVSYATGAAGDPATADRGIVSNVRGNTDRWLENGSYLRLRNVELSYSIPQNVTGKLAISSARVYVSAQNLLTFTKYQGLDPDVVGANFNLQPGVDLGGYPASRIISFGLNLGF